jgi:phosphoribosylaminoimidazolecarboxamide formyltransferase/IMP cyclohydrolase
MDSLPIKRALISVSNKAGVVEFAKALSSRGIQIISTGGTLETLKAAGVAAISVSDVTHFPEILDGRVKTLHPSIHAGILAVTENPAHVQQLKEHDVELIDLVVVNLYPFEQTISKHDVSLDEAIEQIDVGGPSMVRAAAKNYKYKAVVVNPTQYGAILEELDAKNNCIGEKTRFALAKAAFVHTAQYDAVISGFLNGVSDAARLSPLPTTLAVHLGKTQALRYGENPHQTAAVYGEFSSYFETLHGKELSYNNIVDIQAAAALTEEFDEPTAAIIKHTNPSGVGTARTILDAYTYALETDSKSAFGGIICMNRTLDEETARLIDKIFTEVIIAPEYDAEALAFLKKKKDRRLIKQMKRVTNPRGYELRTIAGGFLAQTTDALENELTNLKTVTRRKPSDEELRAMAFAWKVAKHVKSNAIVYSRTHRTIGIGAGQPSRFDASRIAVLKAQEAGLSLDGTVVASDAFFPFADGLLEAVKVGATAVIQPGGSVRDEEVIAAADEHNIAMVFTGVRHFKH